MNEKRVHDLLEQVEYLGADGQRWVFRVGNDITRLEDKDRLWIQVEFLDFNDDHQTGRKWRLSQHMTDSEIVLTAWKAVLTAEEHEARERFRFQGARIFGPHISVYKLAEVARQLDCLDLRSV